MTFEQSCFALQRGEIDFDRFLYLTKKTWNNLAEYLIGRWRAPIWFTREDAVQELLIGAWKAVWNFDEDRGVNFRRFLIFNACDYAKKKLHKARGASLSGNADANPGHMEKSFSEFVAADAEEQDASIAIDRLLSSPPAQELNVERVGTALEACRTDTEVAVVQILSCAGSLEEGIELILSSRTKRKQCGARSEQQACSVVEQVAVAVANRIAAA
jgi:DNA-directed RNA polymerase specialized sigma24 family protein